MENQNKETSQVGQKIKKLRELRNYTQEYMAKKLDLSMNGYGKIEREETELTLNRLNEIAKILEVKVFDLLGFDESKIFFNQSSHDSSTGASIVLQQQEITNNERKLYESRIESQQKEIEKLHDLLKQALTK